MLTIAPATLAALNTRAQPGFALTVREVLAAKYPHFLPRFPEAVQAAIVANMLGRATGWGLRRQRGLLAFCELMVIVAADFDQAPPVRALLERDPAANDTLLPDLPHLLGDDEWDRIEAEGSVLPFFHAPALAAAPLTQRTAAAVQLALADRPEAARAADAVADAGALAGRMGLAGLADAALVLAGCQSLYGPRPDFLPALLAERWPPRALLAALRLRLALDWGRFL